MRHRRTNWDATPTLSELPGKEPLNLAFAELRRAGLIARQSYLCCGSCACAGIADLARRAAARGRKPLGAVYYHRQDAESAGEDGGLYLGFGFPDDDALGGEEDGQAATRRVGALVRETLERYRLRVEWDGSPDERIFVVLDEERFAEAERLAAARRATFARYEAEEKRARLTEALGDARIGF